MARPLDGFKCISCRCVYISKGRWDLPTCPRCGCRAALFVDYASVDSSNERAETRLAPHGELTAQT